MSQLHALAGAAIVPLSSALIVLARPALADLARLFRPLPNRRKDLPVSDLPIATAPADAPLQVTGAFAAAPMATAFAAAPAADPAAVVTSVVQTVQAHPDVHPSKAAAVITSILAGLYQASPAIFAMTRSGSKTQAEVGLGLGLAEIIVGAFLQPRA